MLFSNYSGNIFVFLAPEETMDHESDINVTRAKYFIEEQFMVKTNNSSEDIIYNLCILINRKLLNLYYQSPKKKGSVNAIHILRVLLILIISGSFSKLAERLYKEFIYNIGKLCNIHYIQMGRIILYKLVQIFVFFV